MHHGSRRPNIDTYISNLQIVEKFVPGIRVVLFAIIKHFLVYVYIFHFSIGPDTFILQHLDFALGVVEYLEADKYRAFLQLLDA